MDLEILEVLPLLDFLRVQLVQWDQFVPHLVKEIPYFQKIKS